MLIQDDVCLWNPGWLLIITFPRYHTALTFTSKRTPAFAFPRATSHLQQSASEIRKNAYTVAKQQQKTWKPAFPQKSPLRANHANHILMLQTFLLSNAWPKLRLPSILFLQASIQSYRKRKILERICSGQKWGTLPTHDWKSSYDGKHQLCVQVVRLFSASNMQPVKNVCPVTTNPLCKACVSASQGELLLHSSDHNLYFLFLKSEHKYSRSCSTPFLTTKVECFY